MWIADLHIHSKYARATSRECVPEMLELWARRKGISLLGTGDFTHPAWRAELHEKLVPTGDGFYALKEGLRIDDPLARGEAARFVVTGEISSIYKKNGRVRKVHNVILLPGLEEADALAKKLEAIGNVHSDGRPILGLDSRDLLEITLEVCPSAIFVPAHIWTPHFSMFGAFSGFDTIEECFEDLTPHIRAIETGLSSDPPMNWRLSALDGMALMSNSDAHSPSKLGREANLLTGEMSFAGLAKAFDGRGGEGYGGTIEFFPEEGKYHWDGHRNCGVSLTPAETEAVGGLCPVCGKKLTIGVLNRAEQLADRPEGNQPLNAPPFERLVPLGEVIGASTGASAAGPKVLRQYETLLGALGSEFYILREAPLEDVERLAGPCVAEGLRRVRQGRVELAPGYDGEYGKVRILDPDEIGVLSGQICFPGQAATKAGKKEKKAARELSPKAGMQAQTEETLTPMEELNPEQRAAVTATERVVAVTAGPGTGKTKTLVSRVSYLVEELGAKAGAVTAVTFTNKAAEEMRQRLEKSLGGKRAVKAMTIGTFHAICLGILSKREKVTLIDEYEALSLAEDTVREQGLGISGKRLLREVSRRKNLIPGEDAEVPEQACEAYNAKLRDHKVQDFDGLLLDVLALFEAGEGVDIRPFTHLLVDEFQDINPVQYRLVQAWSRESKSLFVIGDPDQAIYGFRGADPQCFSRLEEDCPSLCKIGLVRNYRSTPQILSCALPILAGRRGAPPLEPQLPGGTPVRLVEAGDAYAEGVYLAKEINRMVGGMDMRDSDQGGSRLEKTARGFSDIAVLYRTHRQAEELEKCFCKEGIPYVVTGRDRFLSEPEVREVICFFRFALDSQDKVAERMCAKLPGLDALLEAYRPKASTEKPLTLLEAWLEERGQPLTRPLEQLLQMAVLRREMGSFLQTLAMGQEGDLARSGGKTYHADAVSLMTLHGAKGLEFPVVFLCGLRKGILPLEAPGREADPAEERRLFYVGVTRAREELYLTTGGEASCFLRDLPGVNLRKESAVEVKPTGGKQLSFF